MADDERFRIVEVDPLLLHSEKQRVMELLCAMVPRSCVMEVGSTAVQGLIGKQDVDFAVCVPRRRFVATRRVLDAALSRNPGQLSDSQFQGYLVASPLDIAVQLTVEGGPYDDFSAFLAALKASATLREAYNALKRYWDGRPMEDYRGAKAAFIAAALRKRPGAERP